MVLDGLIEDIEREGNIGLVNAHRRCDSEDVSFRASATKEKAHIFAVFQNRVELRLTNWCSLFLQYTQTYLARFFKRLEYHYLVAHHFHANHQTFSANIAHNVVLVAEAF